MGLLHIAPDPKKNLWYLMELRDEDANSPIIYGRTKFRKSPTYRDTSWLTVTPGGELKPKELKDVYMITGWDAFRFDTPVKWAVPDSKGLVPRAKSACEDAL